jgi:glucose-1-phosphate thymidylyltransferase
MKVIIPVAGMGKRLRPHTHTNPKPMLNVAGKPMIHYIVEQIINDKISSEFVFITGYLSGKIEEYLNNTFSEKADFQYFEQKDQKGLGHAVHHAKASFTKNEDALIVLGDTLFDVDLKTFVNNKYSVIGVKEVDDPKRFGVVEMDDNDNVIRFVEKPKSKKVSPSNEAIVGLYYIKNSNALFSSLEKIMSENITTSGEYQLTDALQEMLSTGEKFKTFNVEGWLDCGNADTLLETNRYLLKKLYCKKKYNIKGSRIIKPVFIGKNVKIKDSEIGPFATINDNCRIINSKIKNSIIGSGTTIEDSKLQNSIVGKTSSIKKIKNTLNIGDNSEIQP